jgi:hypothetical protein
MSASASRRRAKSRVVRWFAGSAVNVLDSASRVTVERCDSRSPRSEIGGWRRRTFFVGGGQTLVRDCAAEDGREDFGVGHLAPGPNAFVRCTARRTHGDSGPLGSWATGVLYDHVEIDVGEPEQARDQPLERRAFKHRHRAHRLRFANDLAEVVLAQRLQHVNSSPRQQGRVHLERRVLGGRANESE